MPEIGPDQDRLRGIPWRASLKGAGTLAVLTTALLGSTAMASATTVGEVIWDAMVHLAPHEWAAFGLHLGLVIFGVVTSIGLLRSRQLRSQLETSTHEEITRLKLGLDRANELLSLDDHIVVVFGASADEPEITGDVGLVVDLPSPRRVLAFGAWLPAEQATRLEAAVAALRSTGQSFRQDVTSLNGRHLEAEGRAIGGRAVLRLRQATGIRAELADLKAKHAALVRDTETTRAFLSALPMPVWVRDGGGRLSWVNPAYARAADQAAPRDAVTAGAEFLDATDRKEVAKVRGAGTAFSGRLAAIAAGARRIFDVVDMPTGQGSAGLAVDVTELESVRADLIREMDTHKRTLDQLVTAVAIFDSSKRLVFYNESYRQLWELDPAFLDGLPSDSDILDRLREKRMLPEQPNFREWKRHVHEVYQATVMEPRSQFWHLPGGRTLRVIQNPDPSGGVTYVFDDVTEQLQLESRVNALANVQRETLDNLEEAVAVFGTDGRLSLNNPAFVSLWSLDEKPLADRPHIDEVASWCAPYAKDAAVWTAIKTAVAAIAENRIQRSLRLERKDTTVLDIVTSPLPDGGTLVTFRNVTDEAALEKAARIKSDFVQHVSYQLRTPLTTIIGFAHILDDPAIGELNPRQRDYLAHINASSAALLAIINDVLDLATIDAGAMELDLSEVDIVPTLEAVAANVSDRLNENGMRLAIKAEQGIGSFVADAQRIRQILFNLLSNAIAFSEKGGEIVLEASRRDEEIVFRVRDQGVGIDPKVKARIFDRFETNPAGRKHRGAGLGLSIVQSFVDLHQGTIDVASEPARGTVVTVTLPANLADLSNAAE